MDRQCFLYKHDIAGEHVTLHTYIIGPMYSFLNDFDYTTNFCIYNNYNSMQKSPSYIVFKQYSHDNFNLKYITFVIQQIYTHTQSLRQDPNSYKCFMHMYNAIILFQCP